MKSVLVLSVFFVSSLCFGQKTLDKLLKKYNKETVPNIHVEDLAKYTTQPVLLDSREIKEYKTSHLKGAVCVGYDHFDLDAVKKMYPNKNDTIVVYCSLGIRSETVANKLQKAGYTHVYNLYGGIFEWKNKNQQVIDSTQNITEKIHTFNKDWSKWLKKGEKVYEQE